jgi:DDE family transposase
MLDPETFLTQLYVMVDDFCQSHLPAERAPGPAAALSCSEVVTLALFSQWQPFGSERGFYGWASRHLRSAFPTLPDRSQFNRLLRQHYRATAAFFRHLVQLLDGQRGAYEVLDTSAVPTRDLRRRGRGWLVGQADIGWSNRLGWYCGLRLLFATSAEGVLTGFGLGPASCKDQPLAETFFALRAHDPTGGLPCLPTVGARAQAPYVTDKGFEGPKNHARWRSEYAARVLCPPKRPRPNERQPRRWPRQLHRFLAGIRQIVETVRERLEHTFRLDRERPHDLTGLQARLTAKAALHNFCIWLNRQLGRPNLAFADLVDW